MIIGTTDRGSEAGGAIEQDTGLPPLRRLLGDSALHMRVTDAALAREYGDRKLRPDGDPLGGLVGTVLSQNTSDINSGRAYTSLRLRFPTWDLVRAAPRAEVVDAIRSGGLAEIKSARIQGILDELVERYGTLDLSPLAALPLPEARAALTSLHGVGPKTASCVLLFNLGRPAFPVDTHVHRLSRRIGFASHRASPSAVQDLVEAHLPAEHRYRFHVNLIRHGRTVCRAQRPRCPDCSIRPLCRSGMESAADAR